MIDSLNLSINGKTYGRNFIENLTLKKYIILQTKPLFYWEYSEVALYKYVKVKLDSAFIDQTTQIFLGKNKNVYFLHLQKWVQPKNDLPVAKKTFLFFWGNFLWIK